MAKSTNTTRKGKGKGKGGAFKGNKAWDEVNTLSANAHHAFNTATTVSEIFRNQELDQLATPEQKTFLKDTGTTLIKDLANFRHSLLAIASKHTNKEGDATNQKDNMQAIAIAEEYRDWTVNWMNVVSPSLDSVREMVATIVESSKQPEPQAEAAPPERSGMDVNSLLNAASGKKK